MSIRKFYLRNKVGDTLNLQIPNEQVLVNPSGLGLNHESIYYSVKGQRALQYREVRMPSFNGTILLANETAYDNYDDLILFLNKNENDEPLELIYEPRYETKTEQAWISLCFVEIVRKGDLNGRLLTVPVSITRTTFWFTELEFTAVEPDTNAGKIYEYDYGYTYGAGSSGEVTVENDSPEEAPIEFEIIGEATNPRIRIEDLSGNIISEVGIFDNITASQKIFINTEILDQYIIKTDLSNNEIESSQDMYQKQDFDKENFPLLPKGFSKIIFENDVVGEGTLVIRFRKQRRTV